MAKRLTFLLLVITSILSCNNSETSDRSSNDKISLAINTLMDRWHKDAANAKLEDYLALMHKSSNYIGTDGNENWTKPKFRAFCEPYFAKKKTWDFKPLERNVYVNQSGNTVWFEEILETALGPCRGSGVLEKYGNNWKLKQYVLSMTVPNEDSKKVLNAKSVNDSLFLARFRK